MTAATVAAEAAVPERILPGPAMVTAILTMRVAAAVTVGPPREVRIFEIVVVAAATVAAAMRNVAAEAGMADRAALDRVVRVRAAPPVQAVATTVYLIAVGIWHSLK
jgi:hypothetical protein